MTAPTLTRAKIRAQFDARSFERGERYHHQGRVRDVRAHQTPVGMAITGEVVGRQRYEVYVGLESHGLTLWMDADCSCPVGVDCKHAAALLLEYLSESPRPPAAAPSRDERTTETWLRGLVRTVAPTEADTWPSQVHHRLLFLLDIAEADDERGVWVSLASARSLKNGGYGQPSPLALRRALDEYRPKYILERDFWLVHRLIDFGTPVAENALVLQVGAGHLLARLLATGRCHWQTPETPALTHGPARAARPAWRLAADGMQELDFGLDPPADTLLPLAPPWYLDTARGECGPIEVEQPPEVAARLVAAPRIAPEQVDTVTAALARAVPELPRPSPIEVRDAPAVPPTPWLELHAVDEGPRRRGGAPIQECRARLRFRYGEQVVEAGDERDTILSTAAGGIERFTRDHQAERAAQARLRQGGLAPLPRWLAPGPSDQLDLLPFADDETAAWFRFLWEIRPALEADGWIVTVMPDFPHDLIQPEGWYGELNAAASADWFGVDLGVIVDGERQPLLPLLRQWLASGQRGRLRELEAGMPVAVTLPDGRRLALPAERVGAILSTVVELFDPDTAVDDDQLLLPRARAMAIEAPEGVAWQGAEALREAVRALYAGGIPSAPVPAGLAAHLRGYQQTGLDWLQTLRAQGLAGVLADDMGLGKTVQTLAHVLAEVEAGRADRPSLVVAPTSLLVNWRREAATFAPSLRVATWHGPERHALADRLGEYHLVLTTYSLLARDRERLAAQPFHLAVLDEAQYIKNPRTRSSRAARELDARHRLCLTGTPLENHLGEVWSLFEFLLPGLLGTERQFGRLFRRPIEKDGDNVRRQHLQRRLAPFLLRRRKDEVVAELPPKTEIRRTVELAGGQRDLYESIRLATHREVRAAIAAQGLGRSRIVVLDALLKLRQACCDPGLVKIERARRVSESAKLRLLMELLPEMIEEGRRVLLFSQFTSMLAIIEDAVKQAGIGYVKLTGRTRDRARPIDHFQQGRVPLFLISLKAGGTGLNLTAADTVIHYDPWWNPAVETQATDRAHRIGQDKPVFVYKLVTQGTVEERILGMQDGKRALAEGLFAEDGGASALSPDDVDALFAPLE